MAIVATLAVSVLLIVFGFVLQWLPYAAAYFGKPRSRHRYLYAVLLVRDAPSFAGSSKLSDILIHLNPHGVIDSFYAAGMPTPFPRLAKRDARDYFNDSAEIDEPRCRTETNTRLLIVAGSVRDLPSPRNITTLELLKQAESLPEDKHTLMLVRWFPRLSSPSISEQEGADLFGSLLAKTI